MSASNIIDRKVITLLKCENEFTMPEKEEVETLLTDPSVAKLPVMVLAVVGRSRTGKSFLLNYFLRYLSYLHEKESQTEGGPLGNEEASLDGFPWTNEEEAETKGILLYNHVFKIRMEGNKKVAVIIIDTEGLHGRNKDQILDSVIFALSLKISSFLIFNVKEQITAELVRDLKGGMKESHEGNPQDHVPLGPKLMFLVRDWKFANRKKKYKYGIEDGHRYLSENFQEQVGKLKTFFKDIQCFLMAYPGNRVAGHSADEDEDKEIEDYNGNLAVASKSFKRNLMELSEKVFSPENLVVQQSEHPRTCQEIHAMLMECTHWMNELLHNPTQLGNFKEIAAYTRNAVAVINTQIQKYITDNVPCTEKQLEDTYECLKRKTIPVWKNQISAQFECEPVAILEEIEEQLEQVWEKIKLENEMKTENAVLDEALSVFDKRFDEALDDFVPKDITEIEELKKQAENDAMAKLKENLGDGHPEKSRYEMKLREKCNLRYPKYLKKNTCTRNKAENVALYEALSVYDELFYEALDNFACKDVTEMKELKKQAENEAIAKLRENLGDGHPERSRYEMKLKENCKLRYESHMIMNAALDEALSVFDNRLEEALDNFATKDITEMRKLKKIAEKTALAKLKENLGDGHPEKSLYQMKLRKNCNLRYPKYLKKNTRNKMAKRGIVCAALTGTGMGILGYGLNAVISAGTTAGGATAVTQHIWDKTPNQEESNRESESGQRESENDVGKDESNDEAPVDPTPKQ